MKSLPPTKPYIDSRIQLYRYVVRIAIVVVCAFILKAIFFDTVAIKTDQMNPTLQNGDRLLYSRLGYSTLTTMFGGPNLDDPVIFDMTGIGGTFSCLRIAGLPGDTVAVSEGVFINTRHQDFHPTAWRSDTTIVPASYSPRDELAPFRIPKRGEKIKLDSLSIRDFLYVLSMMRQENPRKEYILKPILHIDDSLKNNYFIRDFYLYQGTFDAVPDELAYDWFFWDRLREYLHAVLPEAHISLRLSILEKNTARLEYRVGKDFFFATAEHWCAGRDSRHMGPISRNRMKGEAVCVLWSFKTNQKNKRKFQTERICKIVK